MKWVKRHPMIVGTIILTIIGTLTQINAMWARSLNDGIPISPPAVVSLILALLTTIVGIVWKVKSRENTK